MRNRNGNKYLRLSFQWLINMSHAIKPSRNLETNIISRFKNNSNNQTLNIMHQLRNYFTVIFATSQTFLLLILLAMDGLTSGLFPVVFPVHLATRFATHSDQSGWPIGYRFAGHSIFCCSFEPLVTSKSDYCNIFVTRVTVCLSDTPLLKVYF